MTTKSTKKTGSPETLSRAGVKALLGISDSEMSNLLQQGLPAIDRGRPGVSGTYDPIAVQEWYESHKGKKVKTADMQESRARKEAAQARMAELELEELEGKVVRIEEVAAQVETEYIRVRSKLLSLPTKASGLVLGMSTQADIQDVLDTLVREVLDELAG